MVFVGGCSMEGLHSVRVWVEEWYRVSLFSCLWACAVVAGYMEVSSE